MLTVLIVDDEPRLPQLLARQLQLECPVQVRTASSGEAALALLRDEPADLVLSDVSMPGLDGLSLLGLIRQQFPATQVAMMTAFAEVETAREAMKRGALDYLTKPVALDEVLQIVQRVQGASTRVVRVLDAEFCGLVGISPAMRACYAAMEAFARSEVPVLISGESGTGKELVARAVHRLSARHRRPLVEVNASALPETMIERELFGHERGAFTGADQGQIGYCESADKGSLFLDEIGELPLAMQPKLLRFLQERRFCRVGGVRPISVDVRVIAATNRDLTYEVSQGRFRQDLLYRLDVARIVLPPLREREGDIPLLLDHQCRLLGRQPSELLPEVRAACERYAWPGNVRELLNTIARAHLLAGAQPIALSHLPKEMLEEAPNRAGPNATVAQRPVSGDLAEQERCAIRAALEAHAGNKAAAARALGISRRRLYSRLRVLGMREAEDHDHDHD